MPSWRSCFAWYHFDKYLLLFWIPLLKLIKPFPWLLPCSFAQVPSIPDFRKGHYFFADDFSCYISLVKWPQCFWLFLMQIFDSYPILYDFLICYLMLWTKAVFLQSWKCLFLDVPNLQHYFLGQVFSIVFFYPSVFSLRIGILALLNQTKLVHESLPQ